MGTIFAPGRRIHPSQPITPAAPTPFPGNRRFTIPVEQYPTPVTPPERVEDLRLYLDTELRRITAAIRALQEQENSYLLYGTAGPVTPVDTTLRNITNYETAAWFDGGQPTAVDQAAGTITIELPGFYRIQANVAGNHAGSANNESIVLVLLRDGIGQAIDIRDGVSPTTFAKAFVLQTVQVCFGGEVFQLAMEATTNIGEFDIQYSMFDVERVSDLEF